MNKPDLKQKIYTVLQQIPSGKVCTYGQVAQLAGHPRSARLVGTTLKNLPENTKLPWHRVINAAGKISFPENHCKHLVQRQRLENEGVLFTGNKVNLQEYLWQP